MRQFSGKGLVNFTQSPPIDVSPIRKVAPHFHQIYTELERTAPDILLMRTVQEALLALYCHKPLAFHHPRDLQDIDVTTFHVCLHAIEKDPYGYQRTVREDGNLFNEFVSAYPLVRSAFGSIYGLSDCTAAALRKRLLLAKTPEPHGTHFMVALCRMLLAIGLRRQGAPATAPT